MQRQCEKCGADLSPLTGFTETGITKIEQLRKWNIDVPMPICSKCFGILESKAEKEYGDKFSLEDGPPEEIVKRNEEKIRQLSVWTLNPFAKENLLNLGLVTSHIVIGTGPLTGFSSLLSDLFGQESRAYSELLNEAEKNCLHRLKESAFNKGASAVIGLQVRYAELSNANGMIMVNMAGTAVAVGKMRLL